MNIIKNFISAVLLVTSICAFLFFAASFYVVHTVNNADVVSKAVCAGLYENTRDQYLCVFDASR